MTQQRYTTSGGAFQKRGLRTTLLGFSAQSTNECILRELQYTESKYMTYLKLFTRLLYVLRLRLLTQNLWKRQNKYVDQLFCAQAVENRSKYTTNAVISTLWLNQVFHDCRNDAGLLSTQYGILVNNVFDTQVSLSIFLRFIHPIDSFNSMSNFIFEKAIQFKNLNTFVNLMSHFSLKFWMNYKFS